MVSKANMSSLELGDGHDNEGAGWDMYYMMDVRHTHKDCLALSAPLYLYVAFICTHMEILCQRRTLNSANIPSISPFMGNAGGMQPTLE